MLGCVSGFYNRPPFFKRLRESKWSVPVNGATLGERNKSQCCEWFGYLALQHRRYFEKRLI